MKAVSSFASRLPQMGRFGSLAVLALIWFVCDGTYASTPAELLEKGIYAEETKGNLLEAVQLYNQIAADPNADRSYVAQAQLRSGLCHLKAGQKSQAVSALDKLTHDFPDKEDLYAMVEKQMPLFSTRSSAKSNRIISKRWIVANSWKVLSAPSSASSTNNQIFWVRTSC